MLPILIVGEFASGKTTAAGFVENQLRVNGEVLSNSDREEYARGVLHDLREHQQSTEMMGEGRLVVRGRHATAFVTEGEDFSSTPLYELSFRVHDNTIPYEARRRLGFWMLAGLDDEMPRVMEIAIGTNKSSEGENPFSHTLADFVDIVEEVGVLPEHLRIIYLEASFETRSQRNQRRPDPVPWEAFEQYAAEGGGLTLGFAQELQERGAVIVRVNNDHDNLLKFQREVEGAFRSLYNLEGGVIINRERER